MLAQKIAKNVVGWKDTHYFEDVAVYFMHITDHKKFWIKFHYEIGQLRELQCELAHTFWTVDHLIKKQKAITVSFPTLTSVH